MKGREDIRFETTVYGGGNIIRYRCIRDGVATNWYPTRTEAWEAAQ
ncbi:hypothetical protein NKI61_29985 [Mesorhizobium sp. M0514]